MGVYGRVTVIWRWLHADERGSIIAVSDGAGNSIATNRYDDWGIPQAGFSGRFGYTGQAWIPELGLWYYKARFYSPTLGRFLQTDPIGYEDQVNLYAYVGNDPVDGKDPTGLDTVVELQSYKIGEAPIQGDYGHQYIFLRDTETGATVISRAGPSAPYPGGVSGAITGSPARGSDGRTVTLVTSMTPAARSVDSSASGTPLGRTVPGSTTTLKEPIGAAMAKLGKFNQSVDSAGITYEPRGTNSNAYAGTGYSALTGRAAPTSSSLPGSNVDLRPVINPPPPPPAKPYDRCTSHPGSC